MKQAIFNLLIKHFLTPDKIIPMVYEWIMAEWAKGKESVVNFLHANLFVKLWGEKATLKETSDALQAFEDFLAEATTMPRWKMFVKKFNALRS